jgi:hypothetical protein
MLNSTKLSHTNTEIHTDLVYCMLIVFIVYFQVRLILHPHLIENDRRLAAKESEVREMYQAIREFNMVLMSDLKNIRDMADNRLELLEDKFENLVNAESGHINTRVAELRAQLESGVYWGKKLHDLQAEANEAQLRQAFWAKALEN